MVPARFGPCIFRKYIKAQAFLSVEDSCCSSELKGNLYSSVGMYSRLPSSLGVTAAAAAPFSLPPCAIIVICCTCIGPLMGNLSRESHHILIFSRSCMTFGESSILGPCSQSWVATNKAITSFSDIVSADNIGLVAILMCDNVPLMAAN